MGTRGHIIIKYNGKLIRLYNHMDSYPEWLGKNILEDLITLLKDFGLSGLIELLEKCKIVDDSIKPTKYDVIKLADYTNLNVSNQSTNDWYCLLRKTQGHLLYMVTLGYLQHTGEHDWVNFIYEIDCDKGWFTCNETIWSCALNVDELQNLYQSIYGCKFGDSDSDNNDSESDSNDSDSDNVVIN